MTFKQNCSVPLQQNTFPSPLCVCICFSKKKKSNCPTLLKRVCCVQYNLPHPPLKVTITFEWSCGVLLCQNPFFSFLCVCICFSKKKNNNNNYSSILSIGVKPAKSELFKPQLDPTSSKGIQIIYTTFCISFYIPPITICHFFFHFKLWLFYKES